MYELKINPINENANGKYFNEWLRDSHTFVGISYTDEDIIITFESEPAQAVKSEIGIKYASLTTENIIPSSEIIIGFDKKKADGIEYFFHAKAKYFGLKYSTGELNNDNIDYVYNKLAILCSMLNNGDWAPAHYHMGNKLLDNQTVSQQDIDNGYTQEVHNNILQDLSDYINS